MVSQSVKNKGTRFLLDGKVKEDMDSKRRKYFTVQSENDTYSVILDKLQQIWSCDCKFNSMKQRECSHIYACKMKEEFSKREKSAK